MKFKFYNQILTTMAGWLGLGTDATEAEVHEAMGELESREEMQTALRTEITAELQTEMEGLQSQITELEGQLSSTVEQLETANQALTTAQTEIEELKAQPAASHTTGSANQEANSDKPWLNNPVNIRARNIGRKKSA